MKFAQVSTVAPCPVCSKTDWCSISEDHSIVVCRRLGGPTAKTKSDKTGLEYHVHVFKPDEGDGDREGQHVDAEPESPKFRFEPLPAEDRHVAYSAFLGMLHLSQSHEQNLTGVRKIPKPLVEVLGYKSFPLKLDDRTKALEAARRALGSAERLKRIPGFGLRELRSENVSEAGKPLKLGQQGKLIQTEPAMTEHDGIVIPVRSVIGQFVALIIRTDQGYRWFSSPDFEGSGAKPCVHVPLHPFIDTIRVRVTEGQIKADIATALTGVLTIGIPSVGGWKLALQVLRELGARVVVIAYDEDAKTKGGVAGSLARFALAVASAGFEVELETWDGTYGKGIDDVLTCGNGEKIVTHTQAHAWRVVQDRLCSAGLPLNPEVDAHVVLCTMMDRVEDDPVVVLAPEALRAWVLLEFSADRTRLQPRLEGALRGSHLTAWRRAVAEEKTRLNHERDEATKKVRTEQQDAAIANGDIVLDRGDAVELAHRLLAEVAPRRHGEPDLDLVVHDEGDLYGYDHDRGIWSVVPGYQQSQAVMRFAGAQLRDSKRRLRINTTKDAASLAADLKAHPGFFAEAVPGIAFSKEFIQVTPEKIKSSIHRPVHRARYAYDFEYVQDAIPKRFLAMMHQAFSGDEDVEHRVNYIQEHVGLSLIGRAPTLAGKALVLAGVGANAKSTIPEVVAGCFPPGTIAGIPPHDWSNDQKVALLVGKLLNIVPELPSRDLSDTEMFKKIVTCRNEPVMGKIVFKPPFEFIPVAGHIFMGNGLPASGDSSHGFWRRVVVLTMSRVFLESEQDRTLAASIVKDEKPEIVSWMIAGAARAVARGRICDPPPSSVEASEEWKANSDPVRRFLVAETLDAPDRTNMTSLDNLYAEFCMFAEANGHQRVSSTTLSQRTKAILQEWIAHRTPGKRLSVLEQKDVELIARYGLVKTENGNLYPIRSVRLAQQEELHRRLNEDGV